MRYPTGAWPIVNARASGMRPAAEVMVSFVGRIGFVNPTVYAEPAKRYDWTFLRGLRVLAFVNAGQDISLALKAIHPIAEQLDVVDEKAGRAWLFCGFKSTGEPMTCRWLDRLDDLLDPLRTGERACN